MTNLSSLFTPQEWAFLTSGKSALSDKGNAAPVSTGNSAPASSSSPPIPWKNVPRKSRKSPASYKKILDRETGEPALPLETVLTNRKLLKELCVEQSSGQSSVQASPPLVTRQDYYRVIRRQEREERLLREQSWQTDVLGEMAGRDPNEIQDPNKPQFRNKAGGRNKPNQRRHTIATMVASNEEMARTLQGREKIRERQQANQEALDEVNRKTGIAHFPYVHRRCPDPLPFVPAVTGTEKERRQRYGLPTTQDQIILAIENKPEVEPEYIGIDSTHTTPCTVRIFSPDSLEYQSLATLREFENALNQFRYSNQWDRLDSALTYVIAEASYA